MVNRFVARMPVVLMLAALALLGHVAVPETSRPELLLAGLPTAVLLGLYLLGGYRSRA